MSSIYFLNILFGVMLLFWPVWFSVKNLRLPLVNPIIIGLMISIPVDAMVIFIGPFFLIQGGLFDKYYQYALFMGNLSSLARFAGTIFYFKAFKLCCIERILPYKNLILTKTDKLRCGKIFFSIFCLSMYMLASSEFGVLNWILNPREGYQFYRSGAGHWYSIAISALSVSFICSIYAYPNAKNTVGLTLLFMLFSYFLGSKSIILLYFVSGVIFLWFWRFSRLNIIFVFGLPIAFFGVLLNFYLAIGDRFEMESIIGYFDHYVNAVEYYSAYDRGGIALFNGQIALSSLWSYVPRVIWEEKPIVYGLLHVNEYFFPGQAELTHTPAFGGAVQDFADFGIIGVIFYGFFGFQSIFIALMGYFIFFKPGLKFLKVNLATLLISVIQYGPAFGTFFPGLLYLLLIIFVAIIMWTVRGRSFVG